MPGHAIIKLGRTPAKHAGANPAHECWGESRRIKLGRIPAMHWGESRPCITLGRALAPHYTGERPRPWIQMNYLQPCMGMMCTLERAPDACKLGRAPEMRGWAWDAKHWADSSCTWITDMHVGAALEINALYDTMGRTPDKIARMNNMGKTPAMHAPNWGKPQPCIN